MNETKSFLKYYNQENYILTDVRNNFIRDGYLNAFDFFCIIIWKANRAKSNIAKRLLSQNSDLEQSVHELTNKIFSATGDKEKLKVLLLNYEFRLPTASAILTILYPDNFTIYDTRVCDTFQQFKDLADKGNFEEKWRGYIEFIECVKEYGPQDLSLRDKDRLLWGKSFYEQLTKDLKTNFVSDKSS